MRVGMELRLGGVVAACLDSFCLVQLMVSLLESGVWSLGLDRLRSKMRCSREARCSLIQFNPC